MADESGNFNWSKPSTEVHTVVNNWERTVGVHLYGQALHELLAETMPVADGPAEFQDYARIWRSVASCSCPTGSGLIRSCWRSGGSATA